MKNFKNCTVALLGGPCAMHVTSNTSRLNQPQSAINIYIAGLLAELHSCVESPMNICCPTLWKRYEECLSCPWAHPRGPDGQMIMALHIYRPRRSQLLGFGVHWLGGCWVTASASFQKRLLCAWARPFGLDRKMAMTLHIYRPRRFQWALIPGALVMSMGTPIWVRWANWYDAAHLYAESFSMNSILEWISVVVAELQHPQNLSRTDERSNRRRDEEHSIVPLCSFARV